MGIARVAGVVVAGIAFLSRTAVARADTGYEGDDLSVRLASAFVRFTDVSTMGGETAANRWSPAINPASLAWTDHDDERRGVVLSAYGSRISFDTGVRIDLLGESGLVDTRRYGTAHLALSQLRSNDRRDRNGLDFDYRTDTAQVQWGRRWGSFGGGATFNYASSEVTQSAAGIAMRHSTSDTYRTRVGALYEPVCDWLIGAVGEYSWSPFRYDAQVPTPLGLLPVSGEDVQRQRIGRVGVSYEYREYCTLSTDYQLDQVWNDRGTLTTHRWNVGVQHNVAQFLFLRAGATIDAHGNAGFLAGVSAALGRSVVLEFGWQYDSLPELSPDFGRSNTLQLALSVRF